jgi:diacylglycerol O-acyltransferase
MRQLTSLDAQFLRMENARIYGHVGGLAVYDPSTAPGGELTIRDICRLVGQRLHLLPVFRWRLAEVPLSLDLPYWIEDPNFDLDFHIRESAVPPPGNDDRLAEVVARIFARPARPPAAAVGALPDPRARGGSPGAADEDPPRGCGRRVGQ